MDQSLFHHSRCLMDRGLPHPKTGLSQSTAGRQCLADMTIGILDLTVSVICCAYPCTKCSFAISSFLEEISFPILLFSSISLHCSFKRAFLSLCAVLWNSIFSRVYLSFSPLPFTSLFSSAICKASSDNHYALAFLFLWDGFGHCLLYNGMNLHP